MNAETERKRDGATPPQKAKEGELISPERRWALSCIEHARLIEAKLGELRLDERAWAGNTAGFLRRVAQAWLDRAVEKERT